MTKKTAKKTEEKQEMNIPAFIGVESTLGAALLLIMKSAAHKHLFASEFEWRVFPAIATKQSRLFRSEKNEPLALVTWASVSEEVEKRILATGSVKLASNEWLSGDKVILVDVISPVIPSQKILGEFQEKAKVSMNLLHKNNEKKVFELRELKSFLQELESKK